MKDDNINVLTIFRDLVVRTKKLLESLSYSVHCINIWILRVETVVSYDA